MKYNISIFQIIIIGLFVILSPVTIFAANPSTPILPQDNIQDPGSTGTPWGGCGPTDSNCYITPSPALSDISAAIDGNVIDNENYQQTWQWNTLVSSGFQITSNSTTAADNTQRLFEVKLEGVNHEDDQRTYATSISNLHTGTNSVNVGLYVDASGGTTNYAAIFKNGYVGIGTETPTTALQVNGTATASAFAIGTMKIQANAYGNLTIGTDNEISVGFDNTFLGTSAGYGITDVERSVFMGASAGSSATSAKYSNFLGSQAGQGATSAERSNFLGESAGYIATGAHHSNFFGTYAGMAATNASYSNLFGYAAGKAFSGNNIGSNNIIIGTNISLPNGVSNAVNIGGVLFAKGTHSSLIGNPSVVAMNTDPMVGIGIANPLYTLHVFTTSSNNFAARFENGSEYCDIDLDSGGLVCSSDRRLKKDIESITPSNISLFRALNPVTYHWNKESSDILAHPGFIAQEVEELFPSLVNTDPVTGLKSLNYTGLIPYTVAMLQTVDIRVQSLPDFKDQNLATKVATFLEGIASGVASIGKVQTDELCVGNTCVTESVLKEMLDARGSVVQPSYTPITTEATEEVVVPEENSVPTDEEQTEPSDEQIVPTTSSDTSASTSEDPIISQ